MSNENTASKSENLLELIALELAYARLQKAEGLTNKDRTRLEIFEETIEQKQAALNMLPIKFKAERLGIQVRFFYLDQFAQFQTPPPAIKDELEQQVWQDPMLSAKFSDAVTGNRGITVIRKMLPNTFGEPLSAKLYTEPEYKLP